jgi:hypothetical protein
MISKPLLKSTLDLGVSKGHRRGQCRNRRNGIWTGPSISADAEFLLAEDNELNAEIARTLLEDRSTFHS